MNSLLPAKMLLTDAEEDGLSISVDALDQLRIQGSRAATDAWMPTLKASKDALVTELRWRERHAKIHARLSSEIGVLRVLEVVNADVDPVIVLMAIRGVATFNMRIPATRYCAFKLLELLEAYSDRNHGIGAAAEASSQESGQC